MDFDDIVVQASYAQLLIKNISGNEISSIICIKVFFIIIKIFKWGFLALSLNLK